MNISHDFQFKIQNKIMATLFELNNHVTISNLKFKLGENLFTKLIYNSSPLQANKIRFCSIQIRIGLSNQPYPIQQDKTQI